jgi:methyl-accepting chemotaxis protein
MSAVDSALATTNTLAQQTTDLVSGSVASINNSSERITNSLAKSKEIFEQMTSAADDMSTAAKNAADGFDSLQGSSSEADKAMTDFSDALGKFADGADQLQAASQKVVDALTS